MPEPTAGKLAGSIITQPSCRYPFTGILPRVPDLSLSMEEIKISEINPDHLFTRGCCKSRSGDHLSMQSCAKMHVTDWLSNLPFPASHAPFDCVEVRFKNNRKDFFRFAAIHELHVGDIVAVEAAPGHDIGIVTLTGEVVKLQMKRKNINPLREDIRKVYRKARQADVEKWMTAVSRENDGLVKCRKFAANLGLKMKVNDVEFQGDDTKATFYYTADDRVDFRELIKILADEFRVRIEMKQIGVRQEASRLGGIGSCGRELCCSTWMPVFRSVSTSAARVQQLSPNPQKLAGQCSKLKCCLNYEYESYIEALREFPPDTTILKTRSGDASILKIDVFARIIWFAYKNEDSDIYAIPLDQVKKILEMNQKGKHPDKLEDFARKQEKKSQLDLVGSNEDLNRFDKNR